MSINKKKLIRLTNIVLSDINKPAKSDKEEFRIRRLIYRDNIVFQIRDKGIDAFNEVIELVSKNKEFENVSLSGIQYNYESILCNLLKKNDFADGGIKIEIDSFLENLKKSIVEWRVFVPIDFLKLSDIDSIKIGNVHLVPYDSISQEMKDKISKCIELTKSTDEEKEQLKLQIENMVLSKLNGKVCANVSVISDDKGAYSKALREIDHVVNLLRCYIPLLFPQISKVKIGIGGIISVSVSSALIFKNNSRLITHSEAIGPLFEYNLTKVLLEYLEKKAHLKVVGDILAKNPPSRSELEKRIVIALRWIGMGVHDEIDCDKFLKFAIALECLLIRSGEEEKSTPIAERCAFILGDTFEKREQIYREIKKLYGIRSAIVHAGKEEVEKHQLQEMQMLAIYCLLNVIEKNNGWKKIDELINWVQIQKFR